jgi:beta-glucosidase
MAIRQGNYGRGELTWQYRSTAFVAAWLPGSEGAGIAEVLFGDYDFKGKLGFTWPKTADQIPIHVGDPDYDPLFVYGFGMSY